LFENRSDRELLFIYVFIALLVTIGLAIFHYFTWGGMFRDPIVIIIVANIEFAVVFYILYLPIKVHRDREKAEKEKKKEK